MTMDQKEIYIVRFRDGTGMNAIASSFQEVIAMYDEENIERIEKKGYEEAEK